MHKIFGLLALTLFVQADVPSEEERKKIVECHTKLREEVHPPASNMQLITYSFEMEKLAQELFDFCGSDFPETDPRFKDVGIAELTSEGGIPQYRDFCYEDSKTYSYERDNCNGHCLNYIRMVWAQTTLVGCALGRCKAMDDPNSFILCTYKPSSLKLESRPYENGTSCSKCPEGYGCQRNQCYVTSLAFKQLTSIHVTLLPLLIIIVQFHLKEGI
uniref:SCP domain-containing protein n=1 Tax=Mesocestoides corti TaxID=53468 RepID=A0A5K3F146_MESCO